MRNKKFIKKTESKNREFISQEIQINSTLKSPYTVKLYGYYHHKDYILLMMEYLNNRDLKGFMRKFHSDNPNTNMSETLTGYFILQILKGIEYLNTRNIVHRDIKPENIMLNTNFLAKLGDFSLSRKVAPGSVFNTSRSGTLPYLSPECVKRKVEIKAEECEKIDIFALGVVMYFLLFNKHPYNFVVSCEFV